MVATMMCLEARECIIAKINKQREEIAHPPMQQAPHERTSPALHYHISKYTRSSYDITAWLIVQIVLLTQCSELHTTPQRPFVGLNSQY
jgi:hypothetical protein